MSYEEAYDEGILQPSLRLAMITSILKPGKRSTECSFIRPISLMGCDIKIWCKAVAKGLEKYLPHLICSDRNGFVRNRYGFHNIRRVINILHDSKDTTMLSLDAHQAFDRIEWGYLFNALPRLGIGGI